MAVRSFNISTHSFDANPSKSQAAPAATAFFVVSQSNQVSVQDILFGVLTVVLAVASVLLAYLQLVHMRNQARPPKLDVEMFSGRKHPFSTSYTFLLLTTS